MFKYWMRPDKNQDYVWSDGHVVSPLVRTDSEQSLKRFQKRHRGRRQGVSAPGAALQGGRLGLFLLKNWFRARTEIDALFTEAKADRMAIGEFTQNAQEITERITTF